MSAKMHTKLTNPLSQPVISARNKMPLSKALAAAQDASGNILPQGRRAAPHPPVFVTKGIPSASEIRAQARASRLSGMVGEGLRGGKGGRLVGHIGGKGEGRGKGGGPRGPIFGRRAVLAQPEAAHGRRWVKGGSALDGNDGVMHQSLTSESTFLQPGHDLQSIFGVMGGGMIESPMRAINTADPSASRNVEPQGDCVWISCSFVRVITIPSLSCVCLLCVRCVCARVHLSAKCAYFILA